MPSSSKPTHEPRLANRRYALVACLLAVLISGLVHGQLDGRWADQPDLRRMGNRLNELPTRCGDWELAAEGQLDDVAAKMLQCYGSVVREYSNPATGDRVNVAVMFGPRGPIAVHTPEVCYSSVGTEPAGTRTAATITIGDQDNHLWKVQFRMRDADSPHLEVWYGWSDGGPWQAAKYPRVWMTDRLYKIQVAGAPAKQPDQTSPVANFLESFLPALDQGALRDPA